MTDLDQVLEVGIILTIETGEYSDYSFSGPVRMLKARTKRQLVDEFKSEWKPTEFGYTDHPSSDDFLPWLVKSGYVEDVENATSWHVGSYGRFTP